MSAEIVDYLLVFWVVLAIVVYTVGNIYDSQLQEKKKKAERERRRQSAAAAATDRWTSGGAAAAATNLDEIWSPSGDARLRRASNLYQSPVSATSSAWDKQHPDNSSSYQQNQYSPSSNNYGDHLQSAYGNYHQNPADPYSNSQHQHQHQQAAPHSAGLYQPQDYGMGYDYDAQLGDMSHVSHAPHESTGQLRANATIPTATGFNSDCVEWVNGVLYLFYTQPEKYGPIISENVYRSLNEKLSNLTSSSSEHSNLLMEFTGLNTHDSTRPELTNIRTESESDKSISASCKIYNRRLSFTLSVRPSRLTSATHTEQSAAAAAAAATAFGYGAEEEQVKNYELILENLEGKLKSMAMLNEKLIVIQFIEKPDTKISLIPFTANANRGYGGQSQFMINEDSLVQLILQAITQVVVDLYFGDDVDFPHYKHNNHLSSAYSNYKHKLNNMIKGSANELKRQLGALSSGGDHHQHNKERKVFVKIIKATNINYNQNVTCLMELDAPRQQAISSTKQGSGPYWDEHFLFSVNERSGELVLELWDSINPVALSALLSDRLPDTPGSSLKRNQHLSKTTGSSKLSSPAQKWYKDELVLGAKFLGLARVNIDDLRRNPVQKVCLPLQPIGATSDLSNSVGGELQLELLFMEHSRTPSLAGGHTTLTTSVAPSPNQTQGASALQKCNSLSSLAYHQGDIVSIDRKLTPSGFVITTTTITKQPSNQANRAGMRQQKQQHLLLAAGRSQSPTGSASVNTDHSFDDMANYDGLSSSQVSATVAAINTSAGRQQAHSDRRSEGTGADSSIGGRPLSRSRSRSRSFIRAIRKRFSFSRTRSRSMGESGGGGGGQSPTSMADYEAHSRASSELSIGGAAGDRAKSVPASRDPSEVPTIVINKGRLSDTASAFSFAHPKSQLVYEVEEPTLHDGLADGPRSNAVRYRYYAVAEDSASQRKWRKRGLKMHVFNEHQFVACHLAGSSTCHLCGRVFSRRPGKQGYKCRNCHLLSHKQCHTKVDHNCPYAKRDGLKLEYIDADPPASLVDDYASSLAANRRDSTAQSSSEQSSSLARSSRQDQQRSSHKSGSRPAMRFGTKSISIEVDDR